MTRHGSDKTANDAGNTPPFGTFGPTGTQAALLALGRSSSLFQRGAFRWTFARWIERLRPGPMDLEIDGVRYRLDPLCEPDTLRRVFQPGRIDTKEIDFLATTHASEMPFVFVDVGANIGVYGLSIGVRRPGARCLYCEPNPEFLPLLTANIALNDLEDRSKVIAVGVGDREAVMTLALDGTSSSLVATQEKSGAEVAVRPLLDILHDAGETHIDAMKVDVEGYEDRVLQPFFQAAPEPLWPKRLLVEHILSDHWQEDAIQLCERAGYRIARRIGFNTLFERIA